MKKQTFILIFIFIILSLSVNADLIDGQRAYWKLNGNATDSQDSNDGTITGPVSTTGKINTAYDFDGVNDRITVPSGGTIDMYGQTAITINAWIKGDSGATGQYGRIVAKEPNEGFTAGSHGYLFSVDDGRVANKLVLVGAVKTTGANAFKINSDLAFDPNVWTMVTMTWNTTDAEVQLYVNGTLTTTSSFNLLSNALPGDDTSQTLYIGDRESNDREFDGIIDEIGIWNRSLTGAEIIKLYNDFDGFEHPYNEEEEEENNITISSPTNLSYIYGSSALVEIITDLNSTCKHSTDSNFNFTNEGALFTNTNSFTHNYTIDTTVLSTQEVANYYKCNQSDGTITSFIGSHNFIIKNKNWNNTVLAIGNSVAKADDYVTSTQTWHYLISQNLSNSDNIYNGITNDNQGIGGSCLSDAGTCLSHSPLVNRYETDFIDRNPRVGILIPNINDRSYSVTKENYSDDLQEIGNAILENSSNSDFIITSLTPVVNNANTLVAEYNERIREYAIIKEIPFFELTHYFNYNSSYRADHIHLNILGNQKLSERLVDVYNNQNNYTMTVNNFNIYYNCNNTYNILNYTLRMPTGNCEQSTDTDWLILKDVTIDSFDVERADKDFSLNITNLYDSSENYTISINGTTETKLTNINGDLLNIYISSGNNQEILIYKTPEATPNIQSIVKVSNNYDTTPTFTLTTDINSNCGYSETNNSYNNCETTGVISHTCTFPSLSLGDHILYFNCSNINNNDYWSTESENITIQELVITEDYEIQGDYCLQQYEKNENIYISTTLSLNSLDSNCTLDVYTHNSTLGTYAMNNIENTTFYYLDLGILTEGYYVSNMQCIKNETLFSNSCNFEVTEIEGQDNKMISNVLTFISIITFFTLMGIVVFIVTKQKNIDHTRLPFWITFLCFSLAIIELVMLIGTNWIQNIGGDISNVLSINFYAIAIIGMGVAFISLIFIVQNIFDFTITEKDKEKW